MLLFDFCSVNPLLPWFLPFVLGLGLGYLLWSKYKSMVKHLEKTNKDLQANLAASIDEKNLIRNSKDAVDHDLQQVKNKLREIESSLSATAARLVSVDAQSVTSTSIVTKSAVIATPQTDEFTSVVDEIVIPLTTSKTQKPVADLPSSFVNDSTLVEPNNLQILEGIGPKVQEILNNNGINTFEQLSQKSPTELRSILDSYGTKYRMIDVNPWVTQAGLAHSGDWDGLVASQREIFMTKNPKAKELVDTKIEKHFMRLGILKKYTHDDLKAVEGIGPKIEQLLHSDGIRTWSTLSKAPVSQLKDILEKAGPRYMLADPTTWPKQAGLADAGEWAALDSLQKALKGGREK